MWVAERLKLSDNESVVAATELLKQAQRRRGSDQVGVHIIELDVLADECHATISEQEVCPSSVFTAEAAGDSWVAIGL